MSRQLLPINEDEVYRLAKAGASNVEIADSFGCAESTIRGRFRETLQLARADRKIRLRRKQWTSAMKGNTKMLIWLGKQELGQSEKVETFNHHSAVISPELQHRMLADDRARQLACELDALIAGPEDSDASGVCAPGESWPMGLPAPSGVAQPETNGHCGRKDQAPPDHHAAPPRQE